MINIHVSTPSKGGEKGTDSKDGGKIRAREILTGRIESIDLL